MHILDFVFPKRCVGCGKIGKYFCDRCKLHIRIIEANEAICPICERSAIDGATHPRCKTRYTIDGLTSFFHYDGVIKNAIKAIKYRYISDLTREFVSLIPDNRIHGQIGFDKAVLVPIPLHESRLRERGFNQAEILAKLLAKRLNISMKTNLIFRNKKTTPQVEMRDRKERLRNMEQVFSASSSIRLSNYPTVLLFDDVFTTGATMRAAASIFKRHGVQFVWGVTMAR